MRHTVLSTAGVLLTTVYRRHAISVETRLPLKLPNLRPQTRPELSTSNVRPSGLHDFKTMLGRLALRQLSASQTRLTLRAEGAFRTNALKDSIFNRSNPLNSQHSLCSRRTWSSTAKRQQERVPETPKDLKLKKAKRTPLQRALTVVTWTAYATAASVAGVFLLGSAIFLHDAFTYTDRHVERVPVNPLALHPETGGPKDLPIARVLVDDEEDEENRKLAKKPKLVIVGGGWGVRTAVLFLVLRILILSFVQALGVLKSLNPGDYHITLISTENFTTFTPLLPCMHLPFSTH